MAIPTGIETRPIAVIGAGTLGRRIGLMLSTRGGTVRLYDSSQEAVQAGLKYIEETLPQVLSKVEGGAAAQVQGVTSLEAAVQDAWLIVEAVPEDLELKKQVFGELDRRSAADAILASNSSSYPTSQMLEQVGRPERVLNMHFYMPPMINAVELMSCGQTAPELIDLLMERLPRYGLAPFRVQRESVGFIFNRIWAAIKRESLLVVAEGVATPEDVDGMFKLFTGSPLGPFRGMDAVGLDVVLAIEEHYATVLKGLPEEPRALLREKIEQGKLGVKSGAGFYDYAKK